MKRIKACMVVYFMSLCTLSFSLITLSVVGLLPLHSLCVSLCAFIWLHSVCGNLACINVEPGVAAGD